VRILKPTTMMNRSGAALASLRADPAFSPARDLLVVVDDFNIACGKLRMRPTGSAGGHNGLKSIEGALQSQDYARLRVGIGPLPDDVPWEDFVLAPFEEEERRQIEALLPEIVQATDKWVREGAAPPGDG
jgi:peptidyl-tRNA hydrolase, PTH1 family